MKYTLGWSSQAVLRDGTLVLLRCVRPEDKALLEQGFHRLSPESRFRRFLSAKPRLSRRELRYFTEVDGYDHVAIGALRHTPDADEGLGIARFVRLRDKPDTAEAAIAVIDAMHHKGLGGVLLRHLTEAAWERDLRWFRNIVLASNQPALRLLHHLCEEQRVVARDDNTVTLDMPLRVPEEGEDWRDVLGSIPTLLRLAAEKAVHVLSGWHTLGHPRPDPED